MKALITLQKKVLGNEQSTINDWAVLWVLIECLFTN